jgi:hypothetical protein
MLMCQYKIIVANSCPGIKTYANESLHLAYRKLTETCDVTLPNESPVAHTTEETITQSSICSPYVESSASCSRDLDSKLDTYTLKDWRQKEKIDAICQLVLFMFVCRNTGNAHNVPGITPSSSNVARH